MNVALLLKWVWGIIRDEGSLWLKLIKAKYLQGCPLLACDRWEGSQFWRSVQGSTHKIRLGVTFSIGDGEGTLFGWILGSIGALFALLFRHFHDLLRSNIVGRRVSQIGRAHV